MWNWGMASMIIENIFINPCVQSKGLIGTYTRNLALNCEISSLLITLNLNFLGLDFNILF